MKIQTKKILLAVGCVGILLLVVGCITWQHFVGCTVWQTECVFPHTQLTLEADRVEGVAPLTVSFSVKIDRLRSSHPMWYCAGYRFDDGLLIRGATPTCAAFQGDSTLVSKTETFKTIYTKPGTYRAVYSMTHGSKTIASSNELIITVR